MNKFKIKLMYICTKTKRLLTEIKKLVLMMMTPTLELICHNKWRVTSPNLIDMFTWLDNQIKKYIEQYKLSF